MNGKKKIADSASIVETRSSLCKRDDDREKIRIRFPHLRNQKSDRNETSSISKETLSCKIERLVMICRKVMEFIRFLFFFFFNRVQSRFNTIVEIVEELFYKFVSNDSDPF